jgi:hypothetical protein
MEESRICHESRRYISLGDYLALRQRLKAVAKPDPFADREGTYRVRSLYFDTSTNRALLEKINDLDNREKFRLRCYNNDFSHIRLEKKVVAHGQTQKWVCHLSKDQCERLILGDLEWMLKSRDPLLLELYTKIRTQLLRPRTIVEHLREPYVYPAGAVRITIDSNIQTGLTPEDFLKPKTQTIPVEVGGLYILEVKYTAFFPQVLRDILKVPNQQASTFSKYAASRIYG